MKPRFLVVFLLLFALRAYSQNAPIVDYKVKTAGNIKERTEMLDALRSRIYGQTKMTVEFVVKHFKAANNYAWFEGDAQRKDGKPITFREDDANDCCHVEALFQRRTGKWIIAEAAAFSTDVWYEAIAKKYPAAPKEIWPKNSPALLSAYINTLHYPVKTAGTGRNNTKFLRALKDKKGNLLGNVYIQDFNNDIFNKLLITKQEEGKTDTLYFINNYLFMNPQGQNITSSQREFNGYKIESFKSDSFDMFGIGKHGASDGATIEWNYKTKLFEVVQEL